MSIYRVIHTADWHLGKVLHDQQRYDEHRNFLAFLLKTIQEKDVNALIIAGDVFDSTNPPHEAQQLYYDFLAEVFQTTKCAIVVTSGNHDSPAHLEAPKDVLKALNIHVVGNITQDLNDLLILLPSKENPKLAIAALPFLRDKDLRTSHFGESQDEIRINIQNGIRKRYQEIGEIASGIGHKDVALIATGHLTVLGASRSESERDTIHIGGLGAVNADIFPKYFSYIALGHLHRPQKVGPQEDRRYSGSPIPLSFSESHDIKEVRLLEFSGDKLIKNEPLEIPVTRKLYRLKTSYEDLESTLTNFQPGASEYPHWVELVVEADDSVGNFNEVIEKLTREKPFKVIKTVIVSPLNNGSLSSNDSVTASTLGDVLGNPQLVFAQRLDQAAITDLNEREGLITAFDELYDIVIEGHRQSLIPQETPKSLS